MPPDDKPYAITTNTPRWFTAIAIIVLFATLFVGGNAWWPIIVLATIAVGLVLLIRTNHPIRRA